MRRSLVALAASTLLAGAAALWAPHVAISPGPLGKGHESLTRDCFACHAPWRGAARERCVTCHDPARLGLATVAGTPRAAPNARANRVHRALGDAACAECHAAHERAERTPVRFVHTVLPATARADCAGCHAANRPSDALHAALTGGCGACHGTERWKPATYDHDRHFRFDANHPPRCADCHGVAGDFKRYSCTGCHEHALEKMISKHRKENVTSIEACARCHRSGNEHDVVGGREAGGGDRDRRGKGKDGEDD